VWKEAVMRCPRPAMEDEQRRAVAEGLVVNEDALGVDIAFVDMPDGRATRWLRLIPANRLPQRRERDSEGQNTAHHQIEVNCL